MNPNGALGRSLAVLRWVVVGLVGASLLVPVLLTVLTSYRLVVVDGGSMEPTYAYGDVLVVETDLTSDAATAALAPGNVVVIGDAQPSYTHRVVAVRDGGGGTDGGVVATLRGDANATDDPMDVTAGDVYGTPAVHLDGALGDAVRWATSQAGRIVLGLALVAAFFVPRPRAAQPGEVRAGV